MAFGKVAPLAGAWIEIVLDDKGSANSPSLPSRERGLKCLPESPVLRRLPVAPLAGAWIEIEYSGRLPPCFFVAPLAGAWIEICAMMMLSFYGCVAPLAGAWIEIALQAAVCNLQGRRSPRGSVD